MKFKRIFTTLLFLTVFLAASSAFSQQIDYANIKVDNLTDAQIKQLIKRAESIGYNDTQLEQMAAAQGMKDTEIQKLKIRVENIRKEEAQSGDTSLTLSDNETLRSYNSKDTVKNINQPANQIPRVLNQPKIFGAALFQNSKLSFEPDLRMATPKSYIIGPDDELLIDITGDNEVSYKLKVSPDGNIKVQYVGLIAVSGLSIEQATSKIRSILAQTYPALKSGRTTVAVNLGNIRSIRVSVIGEVVKPGTFTVSSLSSVFNLLYASGGPNKNGSYRKIEVIRNNKVVSTIDIYSFLLKGLQTGNIRLQDQDIINVPVYQNRIEIVGEVKRPALFELLNTETLQDVIDFAGNFTGEAYSAKIKVLQNTIKERKILDISSTDFNTYRPINGDKFIVDKILDRFENRVEIRGSVFRPGFFELEKGLTLSGLITKAEGVKEDAFLNRGYITRLNPDNSLELLSFDLGKILEGSKPDIYLQREDKIMISSIFDLRDAYKVTIQGEVREPGIFNFADSMSLEALIQMAGGFKEGATPNRIEIARRLQKTDNLDNSIKTSEIITINVDRNLSILDKEVFLFPYDIVTVRNAKGYEVQKQVKVEGEVIYPGLYTISNKNERISDIIKRAGGLSDYAYIEGASLKRPGPENKDKEDKNKIDNQEEERKKLLGLKRIQEAGVKDTLNLDAEAKLIQSDLVGINLAHILKQPQSLHDLILEDGDVIRIPKQLQTVRITGEVLNPNSVVFSKNKSFIDYVDGAGGFTDKALRKSAYVRYANGSVESASKFLFFNNYPKIKPGSEIMIPKRAEREKMNMQSIVGLSTGLASLAAIIISLIR